MILVRLPSTLRVNDRDTLEVHEGVGTVAQLIDVLDRRIPGFREQLDDSVFNFAVNPLIVRLAIDTVVLTVQVLALPLSKTTVCVFPPSSNRTRTRNPGCWDTSVKTTCAPLARRPWRIWFAQNFVPGCGLSLGQESVRRRKSGPDFPPLGTNPG